MPHAMYAPPTAVKHFQTAVENGLASLEDDAAKIDYAFDIPPTRQTPATRSNDLHVDTPEPAEMFGTAIPCLEFDTGAKWIAECVAAELLDQFATMNAKLDILLDQPPAPGSAARYIAMQCQALETSSAQCNAVQENHSAASFNPEHCSARQGFASPQPPEVKVSANAIIDNGPPAAPSSPFPSSQRTGSQQHEEGSRGHSDVASEHHREYVSQVSPAEKYAHRHERPASRESFSTASGEEWRASIARRKSSTQELIGRMDSDAKFGKRRSRIFQSMWMLLNEPDGWLIAKLYNAFWNPLIVCSIVLDMLQQESTFCGRVSAAISISVESLFMVDILLRFAVSPSIKSFLVNFLNFVDVVAALPLGVRIYTSFVLSDDLACTDRFWHGFFFGVVPVARLLKLLRRFDKTYLLYVALDDALEALPILTLIMCIMIVFFSAWIFMAEPAENIVSMPNSTWFVIVTMMTIGYGDVTPESLLGTIATGVLIIVSTLYLAIPLSMVGLSFSNVWGNRRRLLVIHETRKRLAQFEYGADDMRRLFKMIHSTGQLKYHQFRRMISVLKIGLSDMATEELFLTFAKDLSGSVNDREFVCKIFPQAYLQVYGRDDDGDVQDSERISRGSRVRVSWRNFRASLPNFVSV